MRFVSGCPTTQQEDIIAELGDDIRSQIEERESSLQRPLNDDDLAALLKQRGHPMVMAGRYLPQQSLIGPVLYPAYLMVLRIVVLWILVPVFVLIVAPVTIATGANAIVASIQTVWTLAMASVFALGVITVVFAILERRPLQEALKWDPRKLPAVPKTRPGAELSLKVEGPIPRATAIAEVVFGVITTGVCVQVALHWGGFDLDSVHVTPAPVWHTVYWLALITCLAGILSGWTGLMWPTLLRRRAVIRLFIDAVQLVVIGVLGFAGTWLMLTSTKIPAADLALAIHWTDVGMRIALASASIIIFIDVVRELRCFFGRQP